MYLFLEFTFYEYFYIYTHNLNYPKKTKINHLNMKLIIYYLIRVLDNVKSPLILLLLISLNKSNFIFTFFIINIKSIEINILSCPFNS